MYSGQGLEHGIREEVLEAGAILIYHVERQDSFTASLGQEHGEAFWVVFPGSKFGGSPAVCKLGGVRG